MGRIKYVNESEGEKRTKPNRLRVEKEFEEGHKTGVIEIQSKTICILLIGKHEHSISKQATEMQ